MRTLPLRGGARVTVVPAEWGNALGVVTRGRVQLELRDGEPGPVLGRDAGFWLRGTGVRALRNPGRRTATVCIVAPPPGTFTDRSPHHARHSPKDGGTIMSSTQDTGVVDPHRLRRLAGTGFVATLAAVSATTLAAALARAVDGRRSLRVRGHASAAASASPSAVRQ